MKLGRIQLCEYKQNATIKNGSFKKYKLNNKVSIKMTHQLWVILFSIFCLVQADEVNPTVLIMEEIRTG